MPRHFEARVRLKVSFLRISLGGSMKKRPLNNMVKEAMLQAGRLWVAKFLPKHFGPGAVHRYHYGPRSARTLAIKRRAQFVRRWRSNERVPIAQPRGALLWTGDLRKAMLALSANPYAVRFRASGIAGKEYFRAKLRLPHPMQILNSYELRRVVASELEEMAVIANGELVTQLQNAGEMEEMVIDSSSKISIAS